MPTGLVTASLGEILQLPGASFGRVCTLESILCFKYKELEIIFFTLHSHLMLSWPML